MTDLAEVPTPLLILAAVVGFVTVLCVLVWALHWWGPRADIVLTRCRGEGEQYRVTTPAGPAVVTRVYHPDQGDSYEIEYSFPMRGRTRLAYVAPSMKVVERKLATLVAAHEETIHGA